MEVTRILDLLHFSGVRGRFIDLAFKNSSPVDGEQTPDGLGGISVFETPCACPDRRCECICRHIARFYGQLVDDPYAFWSFDTELLRPPDPNPTGIPDPVLLQKTTESGDDCHQNIHRVDPKRADKVRKAIPLSQVKLCINGACEDFTATRAIDLQALRKAMALDVESHE
jgi:hypothetical protein